MNNFKLHIQYDGTAYAGWQSQENAVSVQGTITTAVSKILNCEINLVGSGRTDAGVHALGQVANFKIDEELNLFRFKHSLNSVLPPDIAIKDIENIPENFHSRFDAKRRSYLYVIAKRKSPFYEKYSYLYRGSIDNNLLNNLSKFFLGEHDFTSFSKKNEEMKTKLCNVYSIQWRETKELMFCIIEANRFLHGMVRAIIGTLLKAQNNNFGNAYIKEIFAKKIREAAADATPAKGLFLYKVKY